METENRREFTRVETVMEVDLVAGDVNVSSSQTRDVSLKGIFVICQTTLQPGEACRVDVFLGGRSTGCSVSAQGRVIRCTAEGVAIEFTEIRGLESFDHLRNLVLYNAPESADVEGEFQSHLGIRRI